ncbi:MAG TPA: hypothetical protein VNN72_06935 [Polyangiaceae bacterium]|nr:hypothetical protein [Polyangiaceae bacterium]
MRNARLYNVGTRLAAVGMVIVGLLYWGIYGDGWKLTLVCLPAALVTWRAVKGRRGAVSARAHVVKGG